MKLGLPAVAIVLASALPAAAQSVPIDHNAIRASRVATAVRITEPIMLDGRLDEEAWTQAPVAGDFYQKLPDNGAPATEQTFVRFLYDDGISQGCPPVTAGPPA